MVKIGLGQDSHRFDATQKKICVLGGIIFENDSGLSGNSDADVVLHAICNALTGIHGTVVLGPITDKMCKEGIKDSSEYVRKALTFMPQNYKLNHLSISIEAKKPKILPQLNKMRQFIADLVVLDISDVGISATSGEKLTNFGKGLGIQVFVVATAVKEIE